MYIGGGAIEKELKLPRKTIVLRSVERPKAALVLHA